MTEDGLKKVMEGSMGYLKVISNKKYAILSVILLFSVIFLARNAIKGTLKSSPKQKVSSSLSYTTILTEKIPKKYHISDDVLLEQKKKDPEGLISLIIKRADQDGDGELNEKELGIWIHVRIIDHLDKAIQDNIYAFTRNDKNHDGRMSWEEFFVKFMNDKGYSKSKALELIDNQSSLSQSVKEELAMHKASWSQSELTEPGYLNINEFLSFLHPEHNHVTLVNLVEELIISLDEDSNEKITLEEFTNVANRQDLTIPADVWKSEKSEEFKKIVDVDGNGYLMKKELLMYVDPKNPRKAIEEAKRLLREVDANKDGKLSFKEMVANKVNVLDSKMVDVAKSLHAEY